MKNTSVFAQAAVLAALLATAVPGRAVGPSKDNMPQVEQFALGPGGTGLPDDGMEYCGPTAMTMNVAWLGLVGHSRLAPTTTAGQTQEFFINLDRTLGGLMQADAYNGTGDNGVLAGMELYFKMKGYEGNYTAAMGGIWGDASGNNPTIPTWSDLQNVADNTAENLHFGAFLVGWYDTSSAVWQREGGHFLAIVETPTDGVVVINNPYPNPGMSVRQNIILSDVPANTEGESGGPPTYALGGAPNASDGMQYPNGGTMPPGYTTPVIEEWLRFTLPTAPPAVSTWHLDQGVTANDNLISIGLGHQEVLAPVADSLNGASAFNFYGGGKLTFTREATYTGGTTVTNSTLASTITSGTPFGTGDLTLSQSTLAVSPAGSGAHVVLGHAATFTFSGASQLNLDLGGHTSLAFSVNNFVREGNSTLIIAPSSEGDPAVLGGNVKFHLTGDKPNSQGGMVSPAFVGQNTAAGAQKSGYFLTYDEADGFVAAATTGGDVNQASGEIYATETSYSVDTGTTVALAALSVTGATISGDSTTTVSVGAGAPANKGAGVILNGGTVAVGTLDFGTQQGFVYTGEAGGEISSTVQGTSANYFGPGNVVLSGASVYAGETNVLSGTTMLAESGSITASSRVTVEYGATFNHQGTVGTSSQNVPLTIYGTRTGTGEIYGNVTVASSGLFAGSGTVYGNTTVEGVLSNASTDPSQIMTFDGDVTIKNEGDYYWSLTNTSDLSLNPYIVVDGTLTFESGAQLSLLFNSATDPAVGGAFWSTDQTFVLARAESIDNGEDGDNLSLNAMEYGNSYFYFHIGEAEGMEQLTLHWHAAVPEPSTWALLGLGALAGAVALRRRRRTS